MAMVQHQIKRDHRFRIIERTKRYPAMLKFLLIPIAIFTVASTPTFVGLAIALLLLGLLAVLHLRNAVYSNLHDKIEQGVD